MIGQQLPEVEKVITREQITRYAGASGDHNLLHLDSDFASGSQFGGVIAHGMLTLAFISEMMTVAFGQSWLKSGRLKVRFKGAAYPGDQLRTWGRVVKDELATGNGSIECSVGLNNSRGEEVISGAAHLIREDSGDQLRKERVDK